MSNNVILEVSPEMVSRVLPAVRRAGALTVVELPNISAVLKSAIWVVEIPDGMDEETLRFPGVLEIQGEIEHAFFSP